MQTRGLALLETLFADLNPLNRTEAKTAEVMIGSICVPCSKISGYRREECRARTQ